MSYRVQKPCKVCGKLYTPCSDCENDKVIFRWRTVACSYECGQEYLKRVMEARSNNTAKNEQKKKTFEKSNTKVIKNNKESEKID